MPANKTLCCPHEDCNYTARRPLADIPSLRGHHETPAEPAFCPHGHGQLVEQRLEPKNRKPALGPNNKIRRRQP